MTPVDLVTSYLSDIGYTKLPTPLVINGMKFQFSAVLCGTQRSNDIIIVADTVETSDAQLSRQIVGVGRALDSARANNPLTTILVGPRPQKAHIEEMMTVSRVLPVGASATDPQRLQNWLAVLTPIADIPATGFVADPLTSLSEKSQDLSSEILELIELAPTGDAVVEQAMSDLLTEILELAWETEQ